MLNSDDEVKKALKQDNNNGHWSLKTVLGKIDALHKGLLKMPSEGNYASTSFSGCDDDELFSKINGYTHKLYDSLLFLYWHIEQSWNVGFDDWSSQKTTGVDKGFGQWLTETGTSTYADLNVVPGGFNTGELASKTGNELTNEITLVKDGFPHLMAAFFLLDPWEPPRVGDKAAFLRGFCKKVQEDEFNQKFEDEVKGESGVDAEDLKRISQNVLEHLKKAFQEIGDKGEVESGLTPINDRIYKRLSKNHVSEYSKYLKKIIPELKSELPQMKTAMGKWTNSSADPDLTSSRYYYGFRGSAKDDQDKKNIHSAIEELTGVNGSLQQLSTALTPQQDDEDEGIPSTQHSPQTASDSSSGGIAGGLLGTTALVGGGGGAYALNLLGLAIQSINFSVVQSPLISGVEMEDVCTAPYASIYSAT